MRAVSILIAALLFLPTILPAQDPELKPRTAETEAAKAKAERQITLDIQVTDASGNPIRGLAQSSFQLKDNGQPVPLSSFQEVDSRTATPPVEAVLVLDVMNATTENVGIMRQGIDAFLRQNGGHLPVPVSIVFLTDTNVKINKRSTDGLELAKDFDKLQTPLRVLELSQGVAGAIDREQRSLQAFQMLLKYEAARPGRKLMLWMGQGWPLLAGIRTAAPSPENARRFYATIVDLTTQLRRAHVTLSSVAPLNLTRDDTQSTFLYQQYLKGVTTPAKADSPYLGVQVLATHSGGLVLFKDGDLPAQINRCLADAASYYEITFEAAPGQDPSSDQGLYHSIEVAVDTPHATTRTNTAYYAGPPQSTPTVAATNNAPPQPESSAPNSTKTGTGTGAEAETKLRAVSRLVTLDITAIDKKGTPLSGLKPADFQLTDDGHPVKDLNLEEHASTQGTAQPQVPPSAPSPAPSGAITLSNKPTDLGALNIVAIDLINTPKEERGRLQDQLNAFAKQMPPGTQVALVTMSSDLKILSNFPDGQTGFQRALKKGLGPLLAAPPANIVERGEIVESIDIDHQESLQHKASIDVERQSQRAQITLDDFASIAKWLNPYPGKKNVYWISGGFPIIGKPFGTASYGTLAATYTGQKIPMQDKTDVELETARIAIYPIDVRGAAIADIDGETTADSTSECARCLITDTQKDSDLKIAQQSEMLEIAHATGGVVTVNNDLAKSLLQKINQSGSYYTLSYTPQADNWDGKYHRLKLTVNQSGTQLLYRQGYYARDTQTDPSATMEVFRAALDPNAPSATAVLFKVNILRSAGTAEIQYDIDPASVQFNPSPDARLQAELNLAILEFDAKGNPIEKSLVKLTETTDPGQQIKPSSINAKQTIPLKPGATTLVIGVRDRTTGKFGTIKATLPSH